MDNRGNHRANACTQARLCRRVVFVRSRTNQGPGIGETLALVRDNTFCVAFNIGRSLVVVNALQTC